MTEMFCFSLIIYCTAVVDIYIYILIHIIYIYDVSALTPWFINPCLLIQPQVIVSLPAEQWLVGKKHMVNLDFFCWLHGHGSTKEYQGAVLRSCEIACSPCKWSNSHPSSILLMMENGAVRSRFAENRVPQNQMVSKINLLIMWWHLMAINWVYISCLGTSILLHPCDSPTYPWIHGL